MVNGSEIPGKIIIICKKDGNIVHWSSMAEKVLRWRKQDILGRSIIEILPGIMKESFIKERLKVDFQSIERSGLLCRLPDEENVLVDVTFTRINLVEKDYYVVTSIDKVDFSNYV